MSIVTHIISELFTQWVHERVGERVIFIIFFAWLSIAFLRSGWTEIRRRRFVYAAILIPAGAAVAIGTYFL